MISPIDQQAFTAGQAITVNGEVTDNARLSEIHVHIYNGTSGALLIDINRNPGTATYSINETFQAAAATAYRVEVIAIDNSVNETRTTVNISSN